MHEGGTRVLTRLPDICLSRSTNGWRAWRYPQHLRSSFCRFHMHLVPVQDVQQPALPQPAAAASPEAPAASATPVTGLATHADENASLRAQLAAALLQLAAATPLHHADSPAGVSLGTIAMHAVPSCASLRRPSSIDATGFAHDSFPIMSSDMRPSQPLCRGQYDQHGETMLPLRLHTNICRRNCTAEPTSHALMLSSPMHRRDGAAQPTPVVCAPAQPAGWVHAGARRRLRVRLRGEACFTHGSKQSVRSNAHCTSSIWRYVEWYRAALAANSDSAILCQELPAGNAVHN